MDGKLQERMIQQEEKKQGGRSDVSNAESGRRKGEWRRKDGGTSDSAEKNEGDKEVQEVRM